MRELREQESALGRQLEFQEAFEIVLEILDDSSVAPDSVPYSQ